MEVFVVAEGIVSVFQVNRDPPPPRKQQDLHMERASGERTSGDLHLDFPVASIMGDKL